MRIDEIFNLWKSDSIIDITELGHAALNISILHHKYYEIYVKERYSLFDLESKMKILKKDKFEFYLDGPNEETNKLGWKLPPKGRILKTDIQMYIDSDPDIIDLTLKINLQKEKVEYLVSIIKMITYRNSSISNAIEELKFKSGA